ncbi:MAG: mechanosensitive ion channel domain-containing protein, partial [Eudoraea sp.]|uniref:mechanosensitive ion channel family protein n=1 Tax=Eudoraea sp. TaxID=1979955 RepID=UPI003C730F12
LKEPEIELKQFEKDKNYSYSDLLGFKKTLVNYNETFDGISEPLKDAIATLGNWRADWLKEKTKWDQWHDQYLKENDLHQLNVNFANAKNEISKALGLILPELDKLLKVQETGYNNYLKINSLTVKVNALIQDHRDSALIDGSAPMFSSLYYSQYSKELWAKVKRGVAQIKWPGTSFFMSAWWVLFIQIIVTFLVINLIYRKRQNLLNAKHFSFLAQRPISAGLFIGAIVSFAFYQMVKFPAVWEIVIVMVGGISFIRLVAVLVDSNWKKQFVNLFFILLILLRIFNAINLPLPLSRLFIVLSALAGIVYLFSWLHKVKINNESKIFTRCLHLLVLYVIVILIAEILGKESLAYILFDSMLRCLVTILSYGMLMYFIYGVFDWLSVVYANKSATVNEKEILKSGHKVAFMINVLIAFYIIVPMLLSIWGLYDTMGLALSGMLSLGFTIGTLKISVGIVITALLILYSSYILSVIVQKLMVTSFLSKKDVDKGAQLSIGKLLHYLIMFIGFLMAISALGFELSKLTIMISALGVGIGFGLKEYINNFVSGLILLFDRPIRVGDS